MMFEVLAVDVELQAVIGQGNFSIIKRAVYYNRSGEALEVAAKFLRDDVADTCQSALYDEASQMRKFNHKNVTKLIAVCFTAHPSFILLELIENGDLKSYLVERGKTPQRLSVQHLMRLSRDCVAGVAYLHSQKYTHRDLAARNVLLTNDFVAKISDFGLIIETLCDLSNDFRPI